MITNNMLGEYAADYALRRRSRPRARKRIGLRGFDPRNDASGLLLSTVTYPAFGGLSDIPYTLDTGQTVMLPENWLSMSTAEKQAWILHSDLPIAVANQLETEAGLTPGDPGISGGGAPTANGLDRTRGQAMQMIQQYLPWILLVGGAAVVLGALPRRK